MSGNVSCPVCQTPLSPPQTGKDDPLRCPKCQHVYTPAEPILDVLPAETLQSVSEWSKDVLWWRGNYMDGLNMQAGIIVLRSTYVVFLPMEKAKNLLGTLAAGIAEAASPLEKIPLDWLRRRPDPLQMVQDLWTERRNDFDDCLIELMQRLHGQIWSRKAVRVARTTGLGGSMGVVILNGSTELRGQAPAVPELDALLEGWPQGEVPVAGDVLGLLIVSVLPLLLAGALFIGHLLTEDIPWWAPFIGLSLAGFLYLIAGLKVVVARLRRKRVAKRWQDQIENS